MSHVTGTLILKCNCVVEMLNRLLHFKTNFIDAMSILGV